MSKARGTDSFDYVIVGAGAAGCVIANRLSADPSVRVALVEAGPSDRRFPTNIKTALPIGNIFLLPHARYNWQYHFSGGPGIGGRIIPCPRGRLLGGSTSVNGTVYIRGHRLDYDDWAAMGNTGWSYDEVLQAFKGHENFTGGTGPFHGSGGELDVQRLARPNALAMAFVESAVAAGYERNADFNGAEQDGFGLFHVNHRRGVRLSSSRAFLHPVLSRSNLQVITGALVEKVRLQKTRAVGVTLRSTGGCRELHARREVVLAAGTINSAQLLLLSGIGPASQLESHRIPVVLDVPGVGRNLQDHPSVSLIRTDPSSQSYALNWRSAWRAAIAPWWYLAGRTGMLASNAAEAGGFIRSQPSVDRPDLQMTFMVGMKENARTLPRRHGFVCHVAVQRPASRGCVELSSADPAARPVIRPGFLENRHDVELLKHGLREARRIAASGALAKLGGEELGPGAAACDDRQLEAYVRGTATTTYHPVGTCRMGPSGDREAVVDPRLRVHGIEGLRVADASIMPRIISGNTAAASMMIGERAAAFMLAS
ncbi:MAG: GMC family oxidoreductase [Burkholderiaceae bacterium]